MNKEILQNIAQEFKTPTYVFDIDILKERIKIIKNMLTDRIKLCYAIKANAFLINEIVEIADKLEVCSPGEMEICKRNKISGEKIIFSGVNKTKEDVLTAYDAGVKIFTAESFKHLQLIDKLGLDKNEKIKILLRLSSDNQFGMDETAILDIINDRNNYKSIEIVGIHYFSGTQKKNSQQIIDEINYIETFCNTIKTKHDFIIEKIEYGPGFKMPYFDFENFADSYKPLEDILQAAYSLAENYDVTFEMGRFIVADCGYYITAINDLKINNGVGYCIVDGGINHISYYGQTLAMKKPIITHLKQREDTKSANWNICGSLCTTADVIVKNVEINDAQIDDILIFHNMGGYSVSEGLYLFLSRDMPRVILYSKETNAVLVRDYIKTNKFNSI